MKCKYYNVCPSCRGWCNNCENDKSDYYQALSGTDLWFMEEVELK